MRNTKQLKEKMGERKKKNFVFQLYKSYSSVNCPMDPHFAMHAPRKTQPTLPHVTKQMKLCYSEHLSSQLNSPL